jgi:integrase
LSQPSNAVIASVIPITASPPLGEAVAEFLARRDPDDDTRRSYGQTMTRLRHEVDALLSRRDVPLREKTLWRLLYESAARADSVLSLDIEDLDKFLSVGADRCWRGSAAAWSPPVS